MEATDETDSTGNKMQKSKDFIPMISSQRFGPDEDA